MYVGAPEFSLTVPAGWKATPNGIRGMGGEFTVTGPFDRLKNVLVLEGSRRGEQKVKVEITLPAPWLIGTANLRQFVWQDGNSRFDPAKGTLAADETLTRGLGWGQPLELAPGHPVQWHRHHPGVNYLGGAEPGNVNMAAVTFFQGFEVAYGARWIYSDHDRPVSFKLGSQSFGGNDYLAVYLNGQSLYSGHIMAERGKIVETQLRKGWNPLVFKSNHLQWQWHFSIDLLETDADNLADLRLSTMPQNN